MRKKTVFAAIPTLWCFGALAIAQDSAREPTLEERVVALEMRLASLESSFELRSALNQASGDDVTTQMRVAELERSLDRLLAGLQRIERQADTALREALQARREATTAQQLARDAANRLR